MRMRALLFAVLACAGAIAVWQMLASEGRDELATDRVTAPVSAPPPARAADAVVAPERSRLAGEADPMPPADARAGAFAYRIRLVEAAARTPLPGAAVRWLAQSDWAAIEATQRNSLTFDPESWPDSRGNRGVADAQGRIVVPGDPLGTLLIARHGELYAYTALSTATPPAPVGHPFAGEIVVELHPDATLRVRTVDPWGGIVPGSVVVVMLTDTADGAEHVIRHYELPASDGDGLVTVPHAHLFVAGLAPAVTAQLQARLFAGDGVRARVDVRDPPAEPVDVVVPAFGSIEVLLFDSGGRPWTHGGDVGVRLVDLGSTAEASTHAPIDAHGRALFDRVRCGARLRFGGPSLWNVHQVVDGPLRQDDRVRVELRLPTDAAHLTGRLVGTDRRPITGTFALRGQSSRGSMEAEFATGADGLFRVVVDVFRSEQPIITVVRREVAVVRLEAEIALREPLAAGHNWVGDVVLAPTPLLVAGHVLHADGTPAAGMRVEIERRYADARGWEAVQRRVLTDAQGRFEARSLPLRCSYRLRVRSKDVGAGTRPVEFTPGTTDLVVRLDT